MTFNISSAHTLPLFSTISQSLSSRLFDTCRYERPGIEHNEAGAPCGAGTRSVFCTKRCCQTVLFAKPLAENIELVLGRGPAHCTSSD